MTPFDRLMKVFEVLRPADGWTCVKLTNAKVTLSHTTHGERICWVTGGGVVGIRGGIPKEP